MKPDTLERYIRIRQRFNTLKSEAEQNGQQLLNKEIYDIIAAEGCIGVEVVRQVFVNRTLVRKIARASMHF